MKRWLLLLLFALAGFLAWYLLVTKRTPKEEVPKDQPVTVSQYSPAFNNSIDTFLRSYYALTEAFVNWDSNAISATATAMNGALAHVKWDDLQKDTVIYQTATSDTAVFRNDINVLSGTDDMTTKRHSFHALTQNLYDLLRTIRYDGAKLYLQQCPMAFSDNEEGVWLSQNQKIRNPYLGLHHPKYKSSMISCGETKDTLNFQAHP